jgi:hypothetical protein
MEKGFLLEPKPTYWICTLCGKREATMETQVHTRVHACMALGGLTVPMIDEKMNCKIEVNEREDYIGNEEVQVANGRPVMNLKTTRDDGEDIFVYAPTSKVIMEG